jgi:ABC-type nitrate/sulfonate/bicarbonate transport system substrate-binding protein
LKSTVLSSTISAVALASLALPPAARGETMALRYGQAYSAIESIYALPIFVADREGFFTREGLDFRSTLIPEGGEHMIAALDDGNADITHVATSSLVKAVLDGADAVAIAAEFDNPIYSLVAKPEIRSFSDLRGRVIGLAEADGMVAFGTRALLARHGIGPKDVRIMTVSGTPDRLYCLTHGPCDAVPLGQPQDAMAVDDGDRLLGRSDDAVPRFLYTVTAVRRAWATTHGAALVRYVRALAGAFGFIRDPARRAAVVHIVTDTTGASPSAARATLALYLDPDRGVLPQRGEIDLDGLRQVVASMIEAGVIKGPPPEPDRFVDLRYLQEAGILQHQTGGPP